MARTLPSKRINTNIRDSAVLAISEQLDIQDRRVTRSELFGQIRNLFTIRFQTMQKLRGS